MARIGRLSPPRSRRWLEMAARARPGAADGSNMWPLELGPEPQMARNGRSSPPRGRRWLEMAARACPGAAAYSTGAARACAGATECSTGASGASPEPLNARRVPLEPALRPQSARRGPLEPALESQHARKVPLEPTAVRCVRFLRSKWPTQVSWQRVMHMKSPPPPPHQQQNGLDKHSLETCCLVVLYILSVTTVCPEGSCSSVSDRPPVTRRPV
jgi:hypothetical protein